MGMNVESDRFRKGLLIVGAAVLLLVAIGSLVIRRYADPYLRDRAIAIMEEKFHSDVDIKELHVSIFPSIRLEGKGLALRHEGRTDVPPLISIAEFSAEGGLLGAVGKPWTIDRVRLKGLVIYTPPKGEKKKKDWSKTKDIPVLIHELVSDNAELNILPKTDAKRVHEYDIHKLVMREVGMDRPADFTAELTNDVPNGEISTKGKFGPWNADDPRQTQVEAGFDFVNADLGTLKGIKGILSSKGKFGGPLEELSVEGETDTPDFSVNIAGHPVALHTKYSATVDATNGNTYLHPVIAQFLNTVIVAKGEAAKHDEKIGRVIALDVAIDQGRIEDVMKLAIKSDKPPLTGALKLQTKFQLVPGPEDIPKRLKLAGKFGIDDASFTSNEVREKIETLSRKGQGKPEDEDAGSAISDLKGNFALGGGIITFRDLSFSVTGARVLLDGTYGLDSEQLDFHGHLYLDAKLSQTMTGVKSFFLKAFDPFFRKGNVTSIPIKITGPRDKPKFGLDFGHKK
jgi:hypothetical protein